jgi:hypothetical protein
MEFYAVKLIQLDAHMRALAAFGQLEDAIQRPFDGLSAVEKDPHLVSERRVQ